MLRIAAVAALAVALTVLPASGPARAANPPTAEDCILYDAAFKAIAPHLGEAGRHDGYRRFAASTFDRARDEHAPHRKAGPQLSLRYCVALQQRVSAAGLDFVIRSPFGIRLPNSAPYEHFSSPVRDGATVYLTYYFSDVQGLNLVLHQGPDGQWSADEPAWWEVILLT